MDDPLGVQKGEAVQNLPAPLLDDLPLDALRLMNVLLQGAGRHDLGDEDDLLRVRQIKVGEEGEDVLVLERLEDVDLGMDLRGLLLADALHVHLAPRDLDALLLVVALEDRLERAVAERVVELQQRVHTGSSVSGQRRV